MNTTLYDVYRWNKEHEPDAGEYIMTTELKWLGAFFNVRKEAIERVRMELLSADKAYIHFNNRPSVIHSDGLMVIKSIVAQR